MLEPYAFRNERIPQVAVVWLDDVREFLTMFPDEPEGIKYWSCHVVARVFAFYDKRWSIVDGHFNGNYQHSWLKRIYKNHEIILDIYPVAGFNPTIVDADVSTPWSRLYASNPSAYDQACRDEWNRQFIIATDILKARYANSF